MAITINVNVTRTSGAAPLGVVFDASGTTSGATSKPFFDCKFVWSFTGPVEAFDNVPTLDVSVGYGPIQARVFNGLSNVTLTVTEPGGATETWSQAIDAQASYAWTDYYFDPVTGNDSNPGTKAQPMRTWDKAMSLAAVGRRCLLNPGTYTDTPGRTLAGNAGPFQVQSLYPDNRAIIQKVGTAGLVSPISSVDCRFIDLDFRGLGAEAANGDCMTSLAPNQLVLRCNFQNWDASIRKGTTVATNDGVVIADSSFSGCYSYHLYDDIISEAGSGGPGRYHRYCAFIGNTVRESLSQPLCRIWWQQSCAMHNSFGTCFGARPQLRWQGRNGAAEVATYCYVADNQSTNAGTGAEIMFQFASAASTDIGLMQWVLAERNLSVQTAGTDKRLFQVTGQIVGLCARHNIGVGIGRFLYIDASHNSVACASFELYNNTHYHIHASATSRPFVDQVADANAAVATSFVMRNNVIALPLSTAARVYRFNNAQLASVITATNDTVYTPSVSGGDGTTIIVCDLDADNSAEGLSWTQWTAGGKDANSIRTDPKFTDAALYDFTPGTASPLIDAGFNLAIPGVDYNLTALPVDGNGVGGAQFDIGAIELIPPPDPPIDPPADYRVTAFVTGGDFGAASVGTVVATKAVNIPAGYEPSGLAHHPDDNALWVVHDGGRASYGSLADLSVAWTNVPAGGNFTNSPDVEDICFAHPETTRLGYIGCERNSPGGADNNITIKEFNIDTGTVVRTFTLTGVSGFPVIGDVNQGLEALTFVPNEFWATPSTTETGFFLVGIQETGTIYVVELSIDSSPSATTVTIIDSFASGFATEISGLHFNPADGILWAVSDADNKIRAMLPDGTLLKEWTAPTDSGDQEGISVINDDLYIGDDSGGFVRRYDLARHGTLSVQTGSYEDDEVVIITATPADGYQVKTWTGTDDNGSDNLVNTVTINAADAVVTCEFEAIPAPSPSTVSSTWNGRQRRRGAV